jgi:hypothetical protein
MTLTNAQHALDAANTYYSNGRYPSGKATAQPEDVTRIAGVFKKWLDENTDPARVQE